MKKFASLLLTVVLLATMLCVFAVPAFAEGEPTVVEPVNGIIDLSDARGDFIIKEDCEAGMFYVGVHATLTIAPNVKVTVKDAFTNFGTLNVLGKLNVTSAYSKTNEGTINVGCVGTNGTIEGTISGTVNTGDHHYVNGVCENCNTPCPHTNKTENVKTYVVTETVCNDCMTNLGTTTSTEPTSAASTLSEGNLAIITAVAGVAVGMAVMFFIMKKKKSAVADGEEKSGEN